MITHEYLTSWPTTVAAAQQTSLSPRRSSPSPNRTRRALTQSKNLLVSTWLFYATRFLPSGRSTLTQRFTQEESAHLHMRAIPRLPPQGQCRSSARCAEYDASLHNHKEHLTISQCPNLSGLHKPGHDNCPAKLDVWPGEYSNPLRTNARWSGRQSAPNTRRARRRL